MEVILTIMKPFFDDPIKEFHIRELSRILSINHTTVGDRLNELVKEGHLVRTKSKLYTAFKSNITKKYLNLKLYHNLEKVRISGLVEYLERELDYPVIVVFGSYATAFDDMTSDADLCIITDIEKDVALEKYEKSINRKISLHLFTKKRWKEMPRTNKGLLNNICNGIVLSGQLEAIP